MEIYWRDSFTCPTEEEYKQMTVRSKLFLAWFGSVGNLSSDFHIWNETETGGLFGLAVRLMQLFSDNSIDLGPLMATLGLYFQIRDDYANLNLKEVFLRYLNCSWIFITLGIIREYRQQYAENKSFCEDLTEGKFSFPVIHAIRSRPDDQQIISVLRQRTKDIDVKRYCVSLLEKFGSFDYTRQTMVRLDLDARTEIAKLGGNPILERVLDELKNW